MLDLYWGEFLITPIPLHLSLNYCSHKCGYCFANLNQPGRQVALQPIMNLLADYQKRDTPVAKLLTAGYPVCVSNLVDPLATSNVEASMPILRLMGELDIPVQIQTKGGKQRDVDELLSFLPPSVFYVSIAMTDDNLRAAIEPNAPTIPDRLNLLRQLSAHGHKVVVGLNPLVPGWLPDPRPLLEQVKAAGATGVWVERLHLSPRQQATMTPRERAAVGADPLARARLRGPDGVELSHFNQARSSATDMGLEVFSIGQGIRSLFFQPYEQTYPTFPTMQGFINLCHEGSFGGRLITFADFCSYFEPRLPAWSGNINHYIGAVARAVGREDRGGAKLPSPASYRDILRLIWSDRRIRQCPARYACFGWAFERQPSGQNIQLVDAEGLPLLVFVPSGMDDYFVEYRG